MSHSIRNLFFSPQLALSLSSLFWAGNFVIGRALREDIHPVALNYWRWSVAVAILLPFTSRIFRQHARLMLQRWKYMLVMSITGIAGFHICVYQALQTTMAINALLFLSISPVMIVVGSRLMFHERVFARQVFGIGISLAGVLALLTRGDINQLLALQFNRGDLWMLLAVLLWSTYSVILKRKPAELPQQAFITGLAIYGVLLMLPLYLVTKPAGLGITISTSTITAILYMGIFASVAAYFCWNYGVSQLGPNKAGVFLHLMPLFGAVLSVLFLGENIQLYHLLGAVMIAAGIILSNKKTISG